MIPFPIPILKTLFGERSGPGTYAIGRVKHIVLGRYTHNGQKDTEYYSPRDIGKILFQPMYSGINMSDSVTTSRPAYPIFGSINQYPLLHEIVLIFPGPSPQLNDRVNAQDLYYFPPFSTWNSPQHNAFPNMDEWGQFIMNFGNQGDSKNVVALPLGKTFEEKKDIRRLRPFEGDVIIESRFGSSIRFGSTVIGTGKTSLNPWSDSGRNGAPITILRNGQGPQKSNDFFDTTVEDLNADDSCIYLTSGQNIIFKDLEKWPLGSYLTMAKVNQVVTEVDRYNAQREVVGAATADREVLVPSTRYGPNLS